LNHVALSWTGLLPDVQTHLLEKESTVGRLTTELLQPLINHHLQTGLTQQHEQQEEAPGAGQSQAAPAAAATSAGPGGLLARFQTWVRGAVERVVPYDLGARIYADAFERHSLLDDAGFALWGLTCIWAMWRLSQPPCSPPPEGLVFRLGAAEAESAWREHPRLVGQHFSSYLLGQAGICLAHFLSDTWMQQFMQAFAAGGYAVLALRVREYFQKLCAYEAQQALGRVAAASVGGSGGAKKGGGSAKVAAAARAEAERPPTPSGHGEWRKLSLQVKRRISRGGFVYEHAPMQPGYLFVLGVWLFAFVVGW
jgi:hypothetical protein